ADLVITNGKVHTVSGENPEAQAVAVKGKHILAVGSNEEVGRFVGPETKVLDVEGKLVIPGLIDAHCHFAGGGRRLTMLSLRGANSIEEIQALIAERIKELPEGAAVWAVGRLRSPELYPDTIWATKEILDPVSPNNPVVLRRGGGHALLLNSVALKQSGITKDSVAPQGGEVKKDPKTGEPTGILREAGRQLSKIEMQTTPREDILRALKHTENLALTGIQIAGINPEIIETYKELNQEGKLTIRVYAALNGRSIDVDEYIEKGLKQGQGDDMVKIGYYKFLIDGTLGVRSALMFEDFIEEPGNRGLAQFKEEEFYNLVERAHKNGYQVGIHAIGDKAVHWTLNAVERAQEKHGKKGLRHRIEHNTVLLREDIPRFTELGVIGSMQPNITGTQQTRVTRLGEERAHRVDMWRDLIDNGAMLCWGTDWAVSPLNPMLNLNKIATRYPEQRLTMAEAIKYYTYGSAYASFEEDIKGTLEAGKLADIVVLSKDLFTIDPEEILTTEVLYKILGGKIIYQKGI
ncbi:amidohydrolase, partial [Acidobacteriota bacterium]